MSNQFLKLRRSAVPGKIPTTSSLEFGEIALNTYDGLAFIKKSGSNGEEIVTIGATSGSFTGSLFGTASWAVQALTSSYSLNINGEQYRVAIFDTNNSVSSSAIYQSGSFTAIRATAPNDPANPDILFIEGTGIDSYNLMSAHADINSYAQVNVQNFSAGTTSSADIVATNNIGDESSYYINMGINGDGYNVVDGIGQQNDAYLYSTGEDLLIGNAAEGKRVIIFNGTGSAFNVARVFIVPEGTVGINALDPNPSNPESLLVEPIAGAVDPSTFSNLIIGKGTIHENYLQLNISNLGTGSAASSDVVATNDIGTETDYYIDMGINSSNYSTPNAVGMANDAYLYSTGEHLHIGNASADMPVMFFAGGFDSEANRKLELWPDNHHYMTGSLDASEGFTGSLHGTASWALNTLTASFVQNAVSASYAATASSADNFVVRGDLTGSNAVFTGTITAQRLVVQFITASTEFITGSTKFGTQLTDTHQFTGSVSVTSSLTVNGALNATSSWATNALTASYVPSTAIVGDFSRIATGSVTASVGVGTASFQLTSGSSTFLFVSSSGNIGINTSTPNYRLDVKGTTLLQGNTIVSGSSLYSLEIIRDGGSFIRTTAANNNGTAGIQFQGAGDRGSIYGDANYNITIEPNAQYNVPYILMNAKNGVGLNVGIGLTNPSARLHVSSSGISGSVLFKVDGPIQKNIIYATASGFVGINTSTPSASLDVSGSFIVNTPASSYDFVVTGSVSGSVVRIGTDQQVLQGNLYVPKLYVKPNYPQNRAGLQISNNPQGSVYAAMYSGFGAESEGLIHGIRLDYSQTSNANDQNGNYFTIAADSRYGFFAFNRLITTGNINSGSNGFASNLYFQNQGGTALTSSGAHVGYKSVVQFATSPILVNSASDFLADTLRGPTNGTLTNRYGLHITFTSQSISNPWGVYQVSDTINNHFNGGVYIGTTTTSSLKLDVSGSARITNGLVVTGSSTINNLTGSLFGTASWALNAVTASFVPSTAVVGDFSRIATGSVTASVGVGTASFQLTSGSSTFVFVSSSGNVGIGTTNPTSVLIVSGAASDALGTILTLKSNMNGAGINLVATDRSAIINTSIRAVGIQVAGIDIARNSSAQIDSSNVIRYINSNGTTYYGYVGQLSTTQFGITSNTDLHLQTNQTSSIYISSASGFVAVGRNYTTASYTLDISGSARVTDQLYIESASIDYQQNLSLQTGSWQTIVASPTGSYRAAFFDYAMFSGSIGRAGTVTTFWSASATEFYENYTEDLGGSTAGVVLQTAISASQIVLQATASSAAWTIRSLVRLI